MKKRKYILFLGIEAMACAVWQLAGRPETFRASSIFAFPFEQIGWGLRALSLSGGLGNAAAVALYVLLSLLPAAALLIVRRKRRLYPEDGLLAVVSALLFLTLYLMINPGLIGKVLGENMEIVGSGKMTLGVTVWSVLAGYLVLCVLRRAFQADMECLLRYFRGILYILGALFMAAAFGGCLGEMRLSLRQLAEENTAGSLNLTRIFLLLRFLADALPYLLDTTIVVTGLELLDELKNSRYGEAAAALAGRLAGRCGTALAAAVAANMGFNLLQLLFAGRLLVVDSTAEFPVMSVLFVLMTLCLTRLLVENKILKADNDLFI